jgi:vacuolar-type H+-ATPase catalytic subunit A/Vma1
MSKQKTTVSKKELTVDVLKQHLTMNKQGDLVWVKDTPKAKAGSVAGTVREKDGYHSIVLLGVNYSGKQLKHFYKTGQWTNFFRKKPVVQVKVEKKEAKVELVKQEPVKTKVKKTKPLAQQIAESENNQKFYDNNSFWENEED